jgi:Kef-type K+ transport system membrane component KefB
MNIFLACGIVFLFALGTSRLLSRLKFPAVTSYLLVGILIGPFGFKFIPENLISSTHLVGYFVLGMIAFLLGESFLWRQFLGVGKEVIIISIGEVVGAFVLVAVGLLLIKQPLYVALLFAGIAPASAPMAIIMVVRELKAKGKFTQTLLNILAIDDAWGIIIFALALAVSKILYSGGIGGVFTTAFIEAGREIFGALFLGAILSILFHLLSRFMITQIDFLIFTLGFILLTTGISLHFGFSTLLANMALGTGVVNFTARHRSFDILRRIDWPFYLLFFVLAGASLEIPLLKELSLLGAVYIISRMAGLYLGADISGILAHSGSKTRKYIGLGLFAQAGVALGLAIIAKVEFPEIGNMIFTTVVATTIVFEIIGPLTCRIALGKMGEISN